MSEHTIPLARRLNSWSDAHPLEISDPALGLAIRPALYAASRNSFTDLPLAKGGIVLGPRSIDANPLAATISHAGTILDWACDKAGPFAIRGRWKAKEFGEWGLRFWVVLICTCTLADGSLAEWRYNPAKGVLATRNGPRHIAIRGRGPPLMATFHAAVEDVGAEFEREGYFYLASRGTSGKVAALRYHLDEMADFSFAAASANDPVEAARLAETALAGDIVEAPPTLHTGRHRGALDAMRDVVGWNTVFDRINRRPYTALSRSWVAQKFGGYGVWLNDVLFHALMAAHVDAEVARENLAAVVAGATAAGNFPCLVTGRDAWVDRSQPPIGGFVLWSIAARLADRSLIAAFFDALLANHLWWRAHRDGNGDGLYEYGTSPIGDGLYRGTRLGARNESCMDNSPVHDEAKLDPETHTLDMADVGLNSLIALDAECLSALAGQLGRLDLAAKLAAFAEAHRERIREQLWDAERRVFANRLWSGRFVRSLAPTSFYPLLAGAADEEQIASMIALLDDPRKFGGRWLLPSVTRDDPAFRDNVYWRGRIWPPLNFLVHQGLKRAGADAAARRLAENSAELFMQSWSTRRLYPENFSAETGQPDDQPDTDLLYGWGGLMPAIAVADIVDVTPWHGFSVRHEGGPFRLGPMLLPCGVTIIESANGQLTGSANGTAWLRTDIVGCLLRLRLDAAGFETELPAGTSGRIELPGLGHGKTFAARLAGQEIAIKRTADGAPMVEVAGGGRLVVAVLD